MGVLSRIYHASKHALLLELRGIQSIWKMVKPWQCAISMQQLGKSGAGK